MSKRSKYGRREVVEMLRSSFIFHDTEFPNESDLGHNKAIKFAIMLLLEEV